MLPQRCYYNAWHRIIISEVVLHGKMALFYWSGSCILGVGGALHVGLQSFQGLILLLPTAERPGFGYVGMLGLWHGLHLSDTRFGIAGIAVYIEFIMLPPCHQSALCASKPYDHHQQQPTTPPK